MFLRGQGLLQPELTLLHAQTPKRQILDSLAAQPVSMVEDSCKIQLHLQYYYAAFGALIFRIPALFGPHHLGATTRWCKVRKFRSSKLFQQMHCYLPEQFWQICWVLLLQYLVAQTQLVFSHRYKGSHGHAKVTP